MLLSKVNFLQSTILIEQLCHHTLSSRSIYIYLSTPFLYDTPPLKQVNNLPSDVEEIEDDMLLDIDDKEEHLPLDRVIIEYLGCSFSIVDIMEFKPPLSPQYLLVPILPVKGYDRTFSTFSVNLLAYEFREFWFQRLSREQQPIGSSVVCKVVEFLQNR